MTAGIKLFLLPPIGEDPTALDGEPKFCAESSLLGESNPAACCDKFANPTLPGGVSKLPFLKAFENFSASLTCSSSIEICKYFKYTFINLILHITSSNFSIESSM